jgi:hypothetical protein
VLVELLAALLLVAGCACGSDGKRAGATAVWGIDMARPPTKGSKSFTALVIRMGCSNGKTGKVFDPTVSAEEDQIVVTFTVKPLPPDGYKCPGNDQVPHLVKLDEPVGDRKLVDGACLAGEAASTSYCVDGPVRWPPKSAP